MIIVGLALYLYLMLVYYPDKPSIEEENVPIPVLETIKGAERIKLGEEFTLDIKTYNSGAYADVLLTQVSFPMLDSIENVRIAGYDYTHAPVQIEQDDEIGTGYDYRGKAQA